MGTLKSTLTRCAVSVCASAALVGVAAVPAGADVPAVGTTFQIKTAFDGTMLCVSSQETDTVTYALVSCDSTNRAQQWQLTSDGREIKSLATGKCLASGSIERSTCRNLYGHPWQEDKNGRVSRQEDNSITRTFWRPFKHNSFGNVLGFVRPSNGTTPDGLSLFAFDPIAQPR
ncbi:ricin-type beta-trefoil lectin domain protein [Streptomyces sp. MBT56]|uniref:ricin-type beta-trefoil lectin domain protein n=1 Tax=unclassified Streptomyces TaxID=2593676 RepID=UPI00190B3060|nr:MULTISPECIES: ricin-type beta-trefoil lectin domain protein [unclassified Streptomyces]MBK3533618.1 ricin-type beta-trefoil lectin domain protein [Streptomyces sp. MBT72]MBK3538107.1 ricin-type beta-trefoil lectin domain protein [Streptomyces sp. MBT67]MBK3552261.1 ricin-type beta-trefoil lectin domain protein [Streptomyces sp. MBT61]MBK3560297.1 ricin-type beta-trefoil lectin domain protein [Streptomyces sp. MBT56]MBK3599963.1 ricin-type beta-trefoil lectin domain protein [Streptomyces sp.